MANVKFNLQQVSNKLVDILKNQDLFEISYSTMFTSAFVMECFDSIIKTSTIPQMRKNFKDCLTESASRTNEGRLISISAEGLCKIDTVINGVALIKSFYIANVKNFKYRGIKYTRN